MISIEKESYVKPKYFMKYTMFKLLLLLAVFPVLAQSGVKGTVIDAITTETLPQVQVSIEGTTLG